MVIGIKIAGRTSEIAKTLSTISLSATEINSQIKITAKIENAEGVNNLGDILDQTYGIMIAHGDLAAEIPTEHPEELFSDGNKRADQNSFGKSMRIKVWSQLAHIKSVYFKVSVDLSPF